MASRGKLTRGRIEEALSWRLRRRHRQRLGKRRQRTLAHLAELNAEESELHTSSVLDLVKRFGAVDAEFWCALTGRDHLRTEDAVDQWFLAAAPRAPISLLGIPGAEVPGMPVEKGNTDSAPTQHQEPLIRYLTGVDGDPDFPFFDCASYRSQVADSKVPAGRELEHFVRHATDETLMPVPDHWVGPPPTWGAWRAAMLRVAAQSTTKATEPGGMILRTQQDHELGNPHAEGATATKLREPDYQAYVRRAKQLLDWQAQRSQLNARVPGRVSVVMPTFFDWRMTTQAVQSVMQNSGGHDVEVIVVENSGACQYELILQGLYALHDSIHVVQVPSPLGFALGSNYGFTHSSGEFVVFLNNDTRVGPGWLDGLVAALADPEVGAAQPLLLYRDGTIQAAGTVVPECNGLPFHFLAHHPSEDARKLGSRRYRIGTAAALMMRASDVVELAGFDERYINGWEDVDLCLRLAELRPAGVVVEPHSVVVHDESKTPGRGRYVTLNRQTFANEWLDHLNTGDAADHYANAGFDLIRYEPGPAAGTGARRSPLPVLRRRDKQVQTRLGEIASLRWAIKIAVNAGPANDHCGDVHLAEALAASLCELGQEVVIDRRGAHDRRTVGLDDVVLVIRGEDSYSPQPGAINILWLMSELEQVSAAEISSYDLAFAADVHWAEQMSAQCRIPVTPVVNSADPESLSPNFDDVRLQPLAQGKADQVQSEHDLARQAEQLLEAVQSNRST